MRFTDEAENSKIDKAQKRSAWDKRLKISEKQYSVEDFEYLLGTVHRDPDDGFKYSVVAVRKYKGLIVVDRKLLGSKTKKYDTIHALDVEQYYKNMYPTEHGLASTASLPGPMARASDSAASMLADGGLINHHCPAVSGRNCRRSLRIAESLAGKLF